MTGSSNHPRRWRRASRGLALVAAATLTATLAAACGGGNSSSGIPTGGKPIKGGTATYALPPNTVPNYIFPMMSNAYLSVANSQYFQYLMYRPLIWPGKGTQAKIDYRSSLIDPPTYKGNKVTIKLKNYTWSDGTPVTSKDVMFWMNMLKKEKKNWAAYVPGTFPDNVKSVKAQGAKQLTFTTDKAYAPKWFTENELSQITPMPPAWDVTASGKKNCAAKPGDCAAVYNYLIKQAKDLKSYATSKIWSVVDGPWKLQNFNSDGHATFAKNPKYTGVDKPRLDTFKELPFTKEESEYNVLKSGKKTIDVGYLPTTDAPKRPAGKRVGRNPVNGYYLDPLYLYGINYFPLNLNNPKVGPTFKQTYVRQAIELSLDQKSVIKGPLRGYGVTTPGPVPIKPATNASPLLKKGGPLQFNLKRAKKLLQSHGWKVKPNGVTTCSNPSKCGPGIKKGQKLEFQLLWATGINWIESEMKQLQSDASKIGIKVDLKGAPFNTVTGTAVSCKTGEGKCKWDAGDWGGGWVFGPDYYPTGETLFGTGASSNESNYTNKQMDKLISKTTTSDSQALLNQWQDYAAKQVPDVWQPNGVYELTETNNKLRGVVPQNVYAMIKPETWYFVK